ncbi:hypothetical protein Pcinc_031496 [Petrolisthes cinctipes]|uniref:Lipase domain-containing protein n=1 Tax=Petrolisthes cinctipes TaxID=88211 RepID=A0AAE1K4F5_PETCI|nr:hypothetical protein Pcinc_031496 [Petrolisthes cinctipes]
MVEVLLSVVAAAPEIHHQHHHHLEHVPHPSSRAKASIEDVHFLLWTKSNPLDGQEQELVLGDSATLLSSSLNPADPTVVIIHGFGGCCNFQLSARDELFKIGSYNVLVVNWAKLSAQPWYNTALANLPVVANWTAQLLEWMVEETGLDVSQLQVVGHSLGAHMAGFIGQDLTKFRLPRITGLDPAGPTFYEKDPSQRIDETDAEFVMIIHTNGGGLFSDFSVGLGGRLGHLDFYPNGGVHQPGCTIGGDIMDLLVGGCSHERSQSFWVESIANPPPAFLSRPCQDWDTYQAGGCTSCGQGCIDMGFHAGTRSVLMRGKIMF